MTGLYVHVPFCSVKCYYCDFAAFSGQGRQAERYLDALAAEAAARRGAAPSPETLYIGGGTPSELSAAQISRFYRLLAEAFPGAGREESSFEANPESLDAAKLSVLAAAGVTRLSLGLQTADDALLRSLGRRHTAEDFARAFRAAREAGVRDLCVDLMHGLPGQTLESVLASLDFVLALQPEHISLYGLQVEDRTLFSRRGVEADEDLGREALEAAIMRLQAEGYEHYEISNFARSGRRSAHNENYWRRGEYLGLGCSAASFLGGRRTANEDRLLPYLEAVEAGRSAAASSEAPEGREALGEEALLGLRLVEGFAPSAALRAAFAAEWEGLRSRGLVREDGPRWRLSREGLFRANEAFREFVPPFSPRPARREAVPA